MDGPDSEGRASLEAQRHTSGRVRQMGKPRVEYWVPFSKGGLGQKASLDPKMTSVGGETQKVPTWAPRRAQVVELRDVEGVCSKGSEFYIISWCSKSLS